MSKLFKRNLRKRKDFEGGFQSHKEFNLAHQRLLLSRLKIVSILLIVTYPGFIFFDFFLLNDLTQMTFRYTLMGVHFTGFLISIFYISFNRYIKRKWFDNENANRLLYTYIVIYILLGAVSSINSQLLTGNITAYLIILIATAVIFPIRPSIFSIIVMLDHFLFIIGLSIVATGTNFSTLMKLVNSTGTAAIAVIIGLIFYNYQKRDFINQYKIKINEENLRKLFEINPYPLTIISWTDNNILLANKQAFSFFHPGGKGEMEFDINDIFNTEKERDMIKDRLKKEKSIKNYVLEQSLSAESSRWMLMNFELIHYHNELCMLIGVTDVTDFKQTENELFKQASTDMLTGVMNRWIGLKLLQTHMNHFPTRDFIICYLDINNLKEVNDTLGHKYGDELIVTVCDAVQKTIGKEDLFFRQGGDEFIIVFMQKQMDQVEQLWEGIQNELEFLSRAGSKLFKASVSHGYYHFKPGSNISIEDMLEIADKEMYREKTAYRQSLI